MRTFTTAARFYAGYKLKALSFLIFITLGFGLIMGAVDLLYNSFNSFFDRPASYFLPRYFITQKKGFDILSSDYRISDITLKSDQRKAILSSLGRDFDLIDVAYVWAMFQSRANPNNRFWALVVGIDFASIDKAFPYFKGKLSKEDVAKFKATPLVVLDQKMSKWNSINMGYLYTLLSTDYFKDYNGIKVKLEKYISTPSAEDDSLDIPIAYIDIKHLRRLFAIPEGRELPLIASPHRRPPALSITDSLNLSRLREVAGSVGASAYSVSTVSDNLSKTYLLYRGVVILLSAILVIVMMAAISASLAINFQNRRADFGLMKAFGCSDRRLLGFVLSENALGLGLPLVLATILNVVLGMVIRPFKSIGSFVLSPQANLVGFVIVLVSAFFICVVSSIQPYRYLKRLASVAIMREE